MSDIDVRARANAARIELRETETAFTRLRQGLLDKLIASPAEASQTRETCYFAVQALDSVKQALRSVVETGLIDEAVEAMTQRPAKPEDVTVAPIRGAGFH